MKAKITIYCCLCGEQHETHVDLPEGWHANRYDVIDEENGFCPKHSAIVPFTDSQCPGCVGSWGDCPLWRSFAYREYSLTEADLDSIRRGVCPMRVNGTMGVTIGDRTMVVVDTDLSSVATVASGEALADAIIEMRRRDYGECQIICGGTV